MIRHDYKPKYFLFLLFFVDLSANAKDLNLFSDVGGELQYLGASFRFCKSFEPHDFHMTHSLLVLHKFENSFIFYTISRAHGLNFASYSMLAFKKSSFLHLINDVLICVYFVLHLSFYFLVVCFVGYARNRVLSLFSLSDVISVGVFHLVIRRFVHSLHGTFLALQLVHSHRRDFFLRKSSNPSAVISTFVVSLLEFQIFHLI